MAKTAVSQWDSVANNNTDINSISLAENVMQPPAVNDAFREMMAQIATGVVVKIAATSSVAAYYQLEEATANGTNKVTVTAPTSLSADITLTLPSTAGTLALYDADVDALAVTGVSAFSGLLYGLTLSNNGTDATNDIDIAAGIAIDSTNAKFIKLASGITKRLDAAWAVGTGNGGLDTGSIANTTYHVWLIIRTDTGVVDVLFSTSATSPTMPTNYDYKRRIGSILRAGGAIMPFKQYGDVFTRDVPTPDVNNDNNPGTSATLRTLSIPAGVQMEAIIAAVLLDDTASAFTFLLVTCPDQTDTTPTSGVSSIVVNSQGGSGRSFGQSELRVTTDTSARVRTRLSASTADHYLFIITKGWVDRRGRT